MSSRIRTHSSVSPYAVFRSTISPRRDHRSRFRDRERLRRDVLVLVGLVRRVGGRRPRDRTRGRRSSPRRRSRRRETTRRAARARAARARSPPRTPARAAASAASPGSRPPAGSSHSLAVDARAVLADQDHLAVVRHRNQHDDGAMPHDGDVVLACRRESASRTDFDREDAAPDRRSDRSRNLSRLRIGCVPAVDRARCRSSGSGARELHAAAVGRMPEGQPRGVQERTLEPHDRAKSPGTRRRTPPYSESPTIGWPIALRCTRIWCVRPVWIATCASVSAAPEVLGA